MWGVTRLTNYWLIITTFVFLIISNGVFSVIERIQKISRDKLSLVKGVLKDQYLLKSNLIIIKIGAVTHSSGSKSGNESVLMPGDHYDNNVVGTLYSLKAMQGSDIQTLIFSSSVSVFGCAKYNAINEEYSLQPVSSYVRTKKHIEEIMSDISASDTQWKFIFLRYFNLSGDHGSGLSLESPLGVTNNVMPYASQVAFYSLSCVAVYGDNYPAKDGIGVRDYIHVVDLARGHLVSSNHPVTQKEFESPSKFNRGTGKALGVVELVTAFEKVEGSETTNKINDRRLGELAYCYAHNKGKKILYWSADKSLRENFKTIWRSQKSYVDVIAIDKDWS